jgi:hypothetical protein
VTLITTAAALAMAAVLLWAGLEKARNPNPTAATLRVLGFPRRLARPAAMVLTAAELTVAIAVLFRPDSALTHISIVLLAGLFALAGLIAMGLNERVHCSCFGPGGKGYLGAAQLIALIPWVAGAGLLQLGTRESPPLPVSAAYFAATSLAIAAARGISVWKARLAARGDRLSALEMYVWLQSR